MAVLSFVVEACPSAACDATHAVAAAAVNMLIAVTKVTVSASTRAVVGVTVNTRDGSRVAHATEPGSVPSLLVDAVYAMGASATVSRLVDAVNEICAPT